MLPQNKIQERLQLDEGYKLGAYKDPLGNWTVGIGHKLPIGDWDGFFASSSQVQTWFDNDLALASKLMQQYGWFHLLDDCRQSILVCMMFNMGPEHFAKFVNMISCLENGNLKGAANEMEDSLWARQVPERVNLYAEILRTGIWQP